MTIFLFTVVTRNYLVKQHELMHVTGFWHEQSRFDRDDYIRIIWENIEPGMEYNFDKYSWDDIQTLDAPYDYGSVMHYGTHAFAKGYGPTIMPKDGTQPSAIIGQRQGLSDLDVEKVNRMYSCKGHLRSRSYTTRFYTGTTTTRKPRSSVGDNIVVGKESGVSPASMETNRL